ncbi:type II toxin-antitoxin system HicA family toxin [Lysobacter soli]|uniref:type II toxin-antitoxin system HicA family toxin n=1 Tax=Lysobacter soli TaxID=453783 RepID=UPI00209F2765|nr:type II toxin-antitoxin system HicA family toxin [Lysobacter soli]UTA52955.1 type II toxin-antitoxin system HicA family toxin [Lysobacter soli]
MTKSADVIRDLERAGWTLARVSGSHHIFTKPGKPPISVPHPKKGLGAGLVHKLRKQAGL